MVSTDRSGRISPDEFVGRLKQIVTNNAEESTRLVARFTEFVRKASRAISSDRTGERTDPEALLSRWLDFNLVSYSVLSTQSVALLDGLLTAAQSTLLPKTMSDAPAAVPRVELRLAARAGDRATTGLVIENHFDRSISVTFDASDLVPSAGPPLPASLISFEPSTLVIAPRGQSVVQTSVTITSDFVVGQTYTATIRLLGFEAKEVGLSVTILAPAKAGFPSPRPPKSAKTAKKQRTRRKPPPKPAKTAKKQRTRRRK
jgi:hypothetical protein